MKPLILSLFLLLGCTSCATARLAGHVGGTMDRPGATAGDKACVIYSELLSAPIAVAIDVVGLPILTLVVLLGGDAWPTAEEYRRGYDENSGVGKEVGEKSVPSSFISINRR